MSLKIAVRSTLLCTALAMTAMNTSAADEWHFVVSNNTVSSIVKLQVYEDKSSRGDFDVGDGIEAGETATLIRDHNTGDEGCEQWIRARFADGGLSPPSKQDLGRDPDSSIEFSA